MRGRGRQFRVLAIEGGRGGAIDRNLNIELHNNTLNIKYFVNTTCIRLYFVETEQRIIYY